MLILATDTIQIQVMSYLYVSFKCNSYAILHNTKYSERVTSI